jgi:hypothetical protein
MIDYARELGLPMRGLLNGQHVGWTTDRTKAETMRGQRYEVEIPIGDEGLTEVVQRDVRVEWVPSHDPRPEARRFDGWQISFPVGVELL